MEPKPTLTPLLSEGNADTNDVGGKASPQPVGGQAESKSEKGGPIVEATGTNAASKRSREASSDESEDESPRKFLRLIFGNRDEIDDLRGCIIKPNRIKTTFEDVHIQSSAIEALENITLAMRHPGAFGYGILSKCGPPSVLLYGPPGTGKTLLVRALAKQARSKIVAISAADISSQFVGVGEKKIKNLFALARKEYPCIIFIDEADAMFRSRSAENQRCHEHYLNQFLSEMDGISSRGLENPAVVAATNRPFDIDEGILRRLGRRIMVDLPDAAAREEILKIHLRGESLAADVDLSELARATSEYTGSDLKNLVISAALTALREQLRIAQQSSSPPASDTPEPVGSQIGPGRVLCRAHFLHAKREIPPSPISDTATKIREFHNKFGDRVHRRGGAGSSAGPMNKTKSSVTH